MSKSFEYDIEKSILEAFKHIDKDVSSHFYTPSTTVSNTTNDGTWIVTVGTGTTGGIVFGKTESRKDFIPTKVIFNPPATICFFPDGSKVIVKCAPDEEFVEEEGVMACITKKIFGTRNAFKKLVTSAYRQPKQESPEKLPKEELLTKTEGEVKEEEVTKLPKTQE